jgi:pyrophosphatase PpaX
VRISADDADASKPDADPIEAALQRLQVRVAETILLGDTPYDIAAGQKAGVATIALRSWRTTSASVRRLRRNDAPAGYTSGRLGVMS